MLVNKNPGLRYLIFIFTVIKQKLMNEIIATSANVALALSLIVGLVFGIAQVKAAARDRRERLTLETLRNFETREFAELIHFVTSHDLPSSRKEFNTRPENEKIIFIQLAQQMESLGLLVAEKLINLDLVDKTLGSFVTTAWEKYKNVFLEMRETIPDPFLGEYFQWLAEHIDDRLRTNPRKPFHQIASGS
jgi:hypothetical protein